jgi:predicted SAM-dependent methyltransferase
MGATIIARPFREQSGDMKYFAGEGIDIGAGGETVREGVRMWDIPDGDARYMASVADNTYDFVYSSHCLEHLTNIEESLTNWVRILKTGGYLFIVVPDWRLYEHRTWPGKFNGDHKFTFSLDEHVDRPDHYHIPSRLLPHLESLGVKIIETRLEDWKVDYAKLESDDWWDQSGVALTQIAIIGQKQ